MAQKIYIGNLPFSASEADLRALFTSHGEVLSCALPLDRDTQRPRGFGFVEMSNEDAANAIRALDGSDMSGRALRVNEAQPRTDRGGAPRGGGGGGGGARW